ncbi:hypothetical protein HFN89_01790 [Rhizobium laguerreae]|nr:hypothetical protein [Rhizobium laguerreae]
MRKFKFAAIVFVVMVGAPAAASATCLTADRQSNSLADLWINNCDVWIGVKWSDQGSCNNWSCGGNIAPGGRSSFTKSRGQLRWVECQGKYCTPRI